MELYSEKVNVFRDRAIVALKSGNIEESITNLKKAWDELPEPKNHKPESFLIAKSLLFIHNKIEQYENALEWAKKLMLCNLREYDLRDREFQSLLTKK